MTVHVLRIDRAVRANAWPVGNVIAVRLKAPPDLSILAWTGRNRDRNQIARDSLRIEGLDAVCPDRSGLRHVSGNERIAPTGDRSRNAANRHMATTLHSAKAGALNEQAAAARRRCG